MPPPIDVELQLRRHGDALRTLAAQLLRGPAVDDAMQEVWIAALREPPRDGASIGGWLRTVLLHVVSRFRRQHARRERHEANAARPLVAGDAAKALAREEAGHRLLAAVGALEPPYRDAIWQRFFEGKAPREIAAASGVPLATVKSRLQRGLAMLRARLGERDGVDWRAGFAAAFGLGREGTAATVVVATGGVLMATWTKVATGVIAAAAALAMWVSWPEANTPASPSSTRGASEVASAAIPARTGPADAAPRTDAATVRAAAPVPAANDPKLATIRGRCVDERGTPLAGCRALLNGWRCNQERMDTWLRDHPEPDWKNPPLQSTAADGVFTFTFWPPPPFQFSIRVDGDDLAVVGARWTEMAEGRVIDFGDVVMVPGVRVQGRVVDDAGDALPNVSVHVDLGEQDAGSGDRETPSFGYTGGSTARDGTFRCLRSLRPGPYRVQVSAPDGLQQPKPLVGTLTRERPVEDIVIVLPRPSKVATIRGRVVDEAGQPIEDARLEADDQETGRTASTRSGRDGQFTLRNVADVGGTVSLRATHAMFEPAHSDRVWGWGSTDTVVTMRAAGSLAVYVRDEDGTAITDFTVRVVRRNTANWSSSDADVRVRGPYAAGFAAVPGICRGSWTLLVEFSSALQRASVVVAIERVANDTQRVDVVAHANTQRTIRVVDAKGEPVAGTRVQVCLQIEGEFGADTYARAMNSVFSVSSNPPVSRALLLMEATTGADGSLVATGPRGRPLGIRVCGPGHLPVHRGDVLFDDEAPLVIAVETGARLYGALCPSAVTTTLQRLNGDKPLDLRLRAARQQERMHPAWFEPGVPVAADGSFDCADLEPGEWKVVMQVGSTLDLGLVTLRSGESTRLDPDLGYLMPGTLQGTLHKNAAPLANAQFHICGEVPGPFAYVDAKTDNAGRFEAQVGAGMYQAVLYGRNGEMNWFPLPSLERATIVASQTTQQDFHVWAGELKVIVRDASGATVPKLQIRVTRAGRNAIDWLRPTDASGATDAELPAEDVMLAVLPKRLQSPVAQHALRQAAGAPGGVDPVEATRMEIARATIVAGKVTTLELRLPPEWEK